MGDTGEYLCDIMRVSKKQLSALKSHREYIGHQAMLSRPNEVFNIACSQLPSCRVMPDCSEVPIVHEPVSLRWQVSTIHQGRFLSITRSCLWTFPDYPVCLKTAGFIGIDIKPQIALLPSNCQPWPALARPVCGSMIFRDCPLMAGRGCREARPLGRAALGIQLGVHSVQTGSQPGRNTGEPLWRSVISRTFVFCKHLMCLLAWDAQNDSSCQRKGVF